MKTVNDATCNGSGMDNLRNHVDEPTGEGTCGICRAKVKFELVEGVLVPREHDRLKKVKAKKKAPLKSGVMNRKGRERVRDRGRN